MLAIVLVIASLVGAARIDFAQTSVKSLTVDANCSEGPMIASCDSGYGPFISKECYNPETHQCLPSGTYDNKVCKLDEQVCGGQCKPADGTCCHGEFFEAWQNKSCCVGVGACTRGCPTWHCGRDQQCPDENAIFEKELGQKCYGKDETEECCERRAKCPDAPNVAACDSGYGPFIRTVCYNPDHEQCLTAGYAENKVCKLDEQVCNGECVPADGTCCHGEFFEAWQNKSCCVGVGACTRGCPTWHCRSDQQCPGDDAVYEQQLGSKCYGNDESEECCKARPLGACTPEQVDPYSTGLKLECCGGLSEKLSDWDQDGRWYYKCIPVVSSKAIRGW